MYTVATTPAIGHRKNAKTMKKKKYTKQTDKYHEL